MHAIQPALYQTSSLPSNLHAHLSCSQVSQTTGLAEEAPTVVSGE